MTAVPIDDRSPTTSIIGQLSVMFLCICFAFAFKSFRERLGIFLVFVRYLIGFLALIVPSFPRMLGEQLFAALPVVLWALASLVGISLLVTALSNNRQSVPH